MWFQHDGMPAHLATYVRQFWNQWFDGHWISWGGLQAGH